MVFTTEKGIRYENYDRYFIPAICVEKVSFSILFGIYGEYLKKNIHNRYKIFQIVTFLIRFFLER
jgi:hypothetical protein